MSDYLIFDRKLYKQNLYRCIEKYAQNFLILETSNNIFQRLGDFSRIFKEVLIYGMFDKNIINNLPKNSFSEISQSFLIPIPSIELTFDEEHNSCKQEYYDLIITNLSLSIVNDIPGALIQYRTKLKAKGIFIATLFGAATLNELKHSFLVTDNELMQGASPHIHPFIENQDGVRLLKRAGFNQYISDSYMIKVRYSKLSTLLIDIKSIGQSNCLINKNTTILPKNYFSHLEKVYKKMYNLEATFEIITITGIV